MMTRWQTWTEKPTGIVILKIPANRRMDDRNVRKKITDVVCSFQDLVCFQAPISDREEE